MTAAALNVNMPSAELIEGIVTYLNKNTSYRPEIGVICGSGLSMLSKCLENPQTIKYEDIPNFPQSTVAGHAGELVFGELNGKQIVCMRGRFHTYEGYDIRTTTLPIRVFGLMGIKIMLVTNAAGGLHPDYNVGDLMIISDHFNAPGLAGKHPLVGPNDAACGGPRFLPLNNAYDKTLQRIAHNVGHKLNMGHKIREKGVYSFASGPTYETPTEGLFLKMIGCTAAGMSTVPEVIVANHCGMKVLGLSLITNLVLLPGDERVPPSHQEVLDAVKDTQQEIEDYVRAVISEIGRSYNSDTDTLSERSDEEEEQQKE